MARFNKILGSARRVLYALAVIALVVSSPILIPVVIAIVERPVVWAVGDKLEHASRRLAGPGSRDCGSGTSSSDTLQASNCAVASFQQKRPFRVRYTSWRFNVDAGEQVSLVGAPDGKVYKLSTWYGNYSGAFGEDVSTERCVEPVVFEPHPDASGENTGIIDCVSHVD